MLWMLLGIITSYILGSIPTAYLFGRIFKGVDIRKFGSGNVGATNAARILGKPLGITVLILDIFKGLIAVTFIGDFIILKNASFSAEAVRIILGLVCVCGHNWTIFLRFKGGKGVATSLGVLLGLAIKISPLRSVVLLAVLTWIIVFALSRIISLASLLTSVSFPIYVLLFKQSLTLITCSAILAFFIIWRHKSNIIRLLQRKEPKFK